jgi:preprotein translocase subunit SecG
MILIFVILIVISALVLGFIVLVQNPKGGGLSGNIAGFSNQFMGVKQTTDVLEKGTWLFAAIIGVLCLFSAIFMSAKTSGGSSGPDLGKPAATAPTQNTTPAQNIQLPTGLPADSTKK